MGTLPYLLKNKVNVGRLHAAFAWKWNVRVFLTKYLFRVRRDCKCFETATEVSCHNTIK